MNMKPFAVAVVGVITAFGTMAAESNCLPRKPTVTPAGDIALTECRVAGANQSLLSVGGQPVIRDQFLGREDRDDIRLRWVFTGGGAVNTGCAAQLYLLDLTTRPFKVIAFGVKNACNEFHWASWGKKRSVIALKNNVKFVYEDGKLTPPKPGDKLFEMIEPPHSSRGGGLTEETAIPFAQDVPLPK